MNKLKSLILAAIFMVSAGVMAGWLSDTPEEYFKDLDVGYGSAYGLYTVNHFNKEHDLGVVFFGWGSHNKTMCRDVSKSLVSMGWADREYFCKPLN